MLHPCKSSQTSSSSAVLLLAFADVAMSTSAGHGAACTLVKSDRKSHREQLPLISYKKLSGGSYEEDGEIYGEHWASTYLIRQVSAH